MALLHRASISPTKAQVVARHLGLDPDRIDLAAAYRFDNPAGEVGLEAFLVRVDGEPELRHVPLTYRAAPREGAAASLVTTMEHTVLGRRWVYDGCDDPAFLAMLATVALTGVGQSAQLVEVDGRLLTRSPSVRLAGGAWGGWASEQVAVDGFGAPAPDGDWTVVHSPEWELRIARFATAGADLADDHADDTSPDHRLTATWAGQDELVVLAVVSLRSPSAS